MSVREPGIPATCSGSSPEALLPVGRSESWPEQPDGSEASAREPGTPASSELNHVRAVRSGEN